MINIKNKKKNKIWNSISVGQALESNDIYLPNNGNVKYKSRPVITVDVNKFNELVIVPASTKKTLNTSTYGKYGIVAYRNTIEITDNEGQPIKVGDKFRKTENCTKLPRNEAIKIFDKVVNHTKFSSENRKKYNKYKNRHKKNRN